MTFHGVLSAIVTPFTRDGEKIDEAALRKLVDQNIEDGVGTSTSSSPAATPPIARWFKK